jgi:hypothetical protein
MKRWNIFARLMRGNARFKYGYCHHAAFGEEIIDMISTSVCGGPHDAEDEKKNEPFNMSCSKKQMVV